MKNLLNDLVSRFERSINPPRVWRWQREDTREPAVHRAPRLTVDIHRAHLPEPPQPLSLLEDEDGDLPALSAPRTFRATLLSPPAGKRATSIKVPGVRYSSETGRAIAVNHRVTLLSDTPAGLRRRVHRALEEQERDRDILLGITEPLPPFRLTEVEIGPRRQRVEAGYDWDTPAAGHRRLAVVTPGGEGSADAVVIKLPPDRTEAQGEPQ